MHVRNSFVCAVPLALMAAGCSPAQPDPIAELPTEARLAELEKSEKELVDAAAAAERLEAAVRHGPLGFLKGRLVRRLIKVFRAHMAVREHPKYMLIQIQLF